MKTEKKNITTSFCVHQKQTSKQNSCRRFDQEAWCIVPRVPASVPPGIPKIRFPPNLFGKVAGWVGCILLRIVFPAMGNTFPTFIF